MHSELTTTPLARRAPLLGGLLGGLLAALAGPAQLLAATPVAHWTFDDGINNYDLTTVTDVANGNDAVWQDLDAEENFDTSGLSYAPGVIGGAVRLGGGTNQFFLVDAVPQIDNTVPTPLSGDPVLGVGATWSAWMYIDESSNSSNKGVFTSRTVVDEDINGQATGQNWAMNWESNDHIDSRVSGTAIDSPASSIEKGEWIHLTSVWGNVGNLDEFNFMVPSHRLYINGVLQAERENTGIFELVESGSWLIGEDSCCGGREFQGLLDDFAIFDSALSTTEVEQLYNDGLNGLNAAGVSTPAIVSGDVNQSGAADAADFDIILANLGDTVTGRDQGDLDGNRLVDLTDYKLWLNSASPADVAYARAAFSQTAPEPCSAALVVALAAPIVIRRRR